MKYILVISLILLGLSNSFNKITAAESIPTYGVLLTIPKDKLNNANEDLSKTNLHATSSEHILRATLTNIKAGSDTFHVHSLLSPNQSFHISLERASLFLLHSDKDMMIIAAQHGKLNHHVYIYPETIIDLNTAYNYSVNRSTERRGQTREAAKRRFS